MGELRATYSVVLRAELQKRERALLEQFSGEITSDSGETLLHLTCTSIDLSHHYYIQLETFKVGDEQTHPLRIPHHYVLLISGDEDHPSMGFLADPRRA